MSKGTTIKINKSIFRLFEDLGSEFSGTSFCTIVKDESGFYFRVEDKTVLIKIDDIYFFLDKDIELIFGNPEKPEIAYKVQKITFPTLRVNFNGYRLNTKTKPINCSTFYVPNETAQKARLTLRKVEDLQENQEPNEIHFNQKCKKYWICKNEEVLKDFLEEGENSQGGMDREIAIPLKNDSFIGSIRYSDDIGWIVKKDSGLNSGGGYGAFIKIEGSGEKSEFKLYLGMTFYISGHSFRVDSIA